MALQRGRRDHPISGVDEFVDLYTGVVELAPERLRKAPESLPSPVHAPDAGDQTRGDILEVRGKKSNHAIDVASVERLVAAPHDLDVLLRHRLSRQSHGLEGFAVRGEGSVTDDLAVMHRPYPTPLLAHADAAALSTRSHLAQGDDIVAGVDELVHVQAYVLERLANHGDQLLKAIMPVEGARVGGIRVLNPDDLGVKEPKHGLSVWHSTNRAVCEPARRSPGTWAPSISARFAFRQFGDSRRWGEIGSAWHGDFDPHAEASRRQ